MALSQVEELRKNDERNPLRRMRVNRGGLGAEEEVMLCQEVGPSVTQTMMLCMETNVHYPTSTAMKLLLLYDDGLSGQNEEEGGGESMRC